MKTDRTGRENYAEIPRATVILQNITRTMRRYSKRFHHCMFKKRLLCLERGLMVVSCSHSALLNSFHYVFESRHSPLSLSVNCCWVLHCWVSSQFLWILFLKPSLILDFWTTACLKPHETREERLYSLFDVYLWLQFLSSVSSVLMVFHSHGSFIFCTVVIELWIPAQYIVSVSVNRFNRFENECH